MESSDDDSSYSDEEENEQNNRKKSIEYKGKYNCILLILRKIAEYLAFFDIYELTSRQKYKEKIGETIIPYNEEQNGKKSFLPVNSKKNIWKKCIINDNKMNALYILIDIYYAFLEQWFNKYRKNYGDTNKELNDSEKLEFHEQNNRRISLLLKLLIVKDGLDSKNRNGDEYKLEKMLEIEGLSKKKIQELKHIKSIQKLFHNWRTHSANDKDERKNTQISAMKQIKNSKNIIQLFDNINEEYLGKNIINSIPSITNNNEYGFYVFQEFLLLPTETKIDIGWYGIDYYKKNFDIDINKFINSYEKFIDNNDGYLTNNFIIIKKGIKNSLKDKTYNSSACKKLSEIPKEYGYVKIM